MHQTEILVALSTKKQVAYATPLGDSDCDKIVTFNTLAITDHDATQISDAEKLGKGHDFTTELQMESFKTPRSFQWDANSFNLPWVLAFGLGEATPTEVDAGKAWSHVFKASDPVANARQNPVTSILEKVGPWQTRKVPSLAVGSFKLSGELEKRLQLECVLQGSGRIITTEVTPPSGSPFVTSYFINQMNKLEIGPTGGSLTDIAADWHAWELQWNNNLQVDLSYYPGSGFQGGDPAHSTLTGVATQPAINDTVVIDGVTYRWVDVLTQARDVFRNSNLANSLINLKKAINLEAGAGVAYEATTPPHPTVIVSAISGTTIEVTAIQGGAAGNAITTTETGTALTWDGGTLADGTDSPLSGAVSGRMEYGRRTCTLTLRIRVRSGSAAHQQLIQGTQLAAKITAAGAYIPTSTQRYGFILDFPKYQYKTLKVTAVGDGFLVFDLEIDPFYNSSNQGPFLATVVNDVAAFLN